MQSREWLRKYLKSLSKEFGNDFGLIFRKSNDIGNKRTKSTPQPKVILNNVEKFITKWKNAKNSDSSSVLSKKVMSEINNLKRHITKGCLSGIDVGCGTTSQRNMNKILSSNRLGVELAHAKLNKLFMKENKKRDCTNSWPTASELNVIAARKLFEDSTKQSSESKPVESDSNEYKVFGIRPKKKRIEKADTLPSVLLTEMPTEAVPIKDFTNENLSELQRHIQDEIEVMSQKNDGGDRASIEILKSLLLEIIKQALAWWATSLSIQTILGERCVNKKEIPSLNRSRMNCKTNSKLFSKINSNDEVEKNADLWGYTVIDIPKDGNCLFKSVAFQLFQLSSNPRLCASELVAHLQTLAIDIPKDGDCLFKSVAFQLFQLSSNPSLCASELVAHLQTLAINIQDGNIDDVAERLRELVVDEWQGEFQENYSEFFTSDGLIDDSVAFMQEAEEYRKKGTFAGSLGDSMPLALANILKLPLMILSTKHNVPFIDICPRSVMTGAAPIFLARYNAGVGHYNAIIPNQIFIPNQII